MAAPDYVPTKAIDDTRIYRSVPRLLGSWWPDRPGDLGGPQPRGDGLGSPGPDQGYALTLAERFRDRLVLRPGEAAADVIAGAVGIANRRASLFGRAPTIHDLTVAFTLWGFLDADADDTLVAERRPLFEELANHHHYAERRGLVDLVPGSTLRLTPAEVARRHATDWRSLLDLPGA